VAIITNSLKSSGARGFVVHLVEMTEDSHQRKKWEFCHKGIWQIMPSLNSNCGYNSGLICENVNFHTNGVEINQTLGELM
jgi:hypothetical protein